MTPEPIGALPDLVAAYQRRPDAETSAVLLASLEPELALELRRWRPQPPALDADDLRQELTLLLLESARRLPTHQEEQWLRRRLFQRARRRLARWLVSERRTQTVELSEEFEAPEQTPLSFAPFERFSRRDPDFDLLYRHHVLGEPFQKLCWRYGITEVAARRRASRARRLLRRTQKDLQKDLRKV